ncbi:MAG TPA: WYL domain-containing protein [Gemmatimonadales bacterium]|jgi:predicted DNA-binding transcriptional regulator YafY|nr:WYL domain-containing protein [Gemmatimonadales bacterium]
MAGKKLQRWMDLLAELLRRHSPVTLEQLREEVPGYAGGNDATVRRMFERDKDELRSFGVPIETVGPEGQSAGYRLRRRDFYLPYLSVIDAEHRTSPARIKAYGYRDLGELAFTADELRVIADGARQALRLGDPDLEAELRTALRKLAVDLPMDGVEQVSQSTVVVPAGRENESVLEMLIEAIGRRKRVSFDYVAVATGATARREAEPLGVFFLFHHWYLAAREPGEALVKNFRVSRMANPKMNEAEPGTPDFERPAGFDLREHAHQRQNWELGDGNWMNAVVAFSGHSGAADAAASIGAEVPGAAGQRMYEVRRVDAFVRWLLPLAGQAEPVSPPELVSAWRDAMDRTLALYGGAA